VGHALRRDPEPARGERAADADAEDEAQQLDEGSRPVGDSRLQLVRGELAHADRERHAGQEHDERRERDDVRRGVQPELGERGGAEARRHGGDRRDHRVGARGSPGEQRDRADQQPDHRAGDGVGAAAAEQRRQRREST
jgi:hypothetical protein